MAKSEIAENITAGWSDRGPFATSIRSFDDFAISIYFGEAPELFDVDSDPDEFHNLAVEPEYASVRDELVEIVLHTWDPSEIARRVRARQHRRLIIQRGTTKPESHVWT